MIKVYLTKKLLIITAVFFAGLLLRLLLIPFGNHPDILSIAGWGKWIYENGPRGFYENRVWIYSWPTQAPLFSLLVGWTHEGYELTLNIMRWLTFNIVPHLAPGHMLWWFDWVWWWERTLFPPTSFFYGFIMWIKVPPIISDLIIALIVYLIGIRFSSWKKALVVAGVFLISPFSWYISALWGQYDQVVTLFVLVAFLALYKRYFFISALSLLIAGQIKPTAVFFIPLYLFYFFYQRPNIKDTLLTALTLLGAFWFVTAPFADGTPFLYTYEIIYPKVFMSDRWMVANHVFNFWQFFYPLGGWATFKFIGIPMFMWSIMLVSLIYLWSFKVIISGNNLKNLFISLYIVAGGTYMFGIGMLDRYFFPTPVFLALLIFFYPKLLKIWIAANFFFLINLFYSWGFPFLTIGQVWKSSFLIRIFSLLQLLTFFVSLSILQVLPNNIFNKFFLKKNSKS